MAALKDAMNNKTAKVAGIAEDIEEHPFPHVDYQADGKVDTHSSKNFSDLAERIGLAPASSSSWHPSFTDFPTPGAHPPASMEEIEYNFPALSSPLAPPATGELKVPTETHGVAIPIRAPDSGHITRIDLPVWRTALDSSIDGSAPPKPAFPQAPLEYHLLGATDTGAPDNGNPLMCTGCQVQPKEFPLLTAGATTVPISLRLYLDPEDASLQPGHLYFLVVRWSAHGASDKGGLVQPTYSIGTASTSSNGTLWQLTRDGAWARDVNPRTVPSLVFSPTPPNGLKPNQLHADWISFQCSINARYIEAYKAATAPGGGQQVLVYSGYSGKAYKATAHNYPSDVASAYSVDWARLAAAGLDVAVAGYGAGNVSATRDALGGRAALVCSTRETGSQAEFTERYKLCDGAVEWFPGSLENDPGYRVPT